MLSRNVVEFFLSTTVLIHDRFVSKIFWYLIEASWKYNWSWVARLCRKVNLRIQSSLAPLNTKHRSQMISFKLSNYKKYGFFFPFQQDQRHFLLPWIAVMVADILIEFIHFIYMIITDAVSNTKSIKQSATVNWKTFLNFVSAMLWSDRRHDVYYWLFPRVYQCNYSMQLFIINYYDCFG